MTLSELNGLDKPLLLEKLSLCCGSAKWQELLAGKFPFNSPNDLVKASERIWYDECGESDWVEAFSHHPKIGSIKALSEKFASTKHLAANEQQSVTSADESVITKLAEGNSSYEKRFGFIFIVSATGKSASEMLRLLEDRFQNTYFEELNNAMGEQHKITIIRFQKMLTMEKWNLAPGQVTTHVLDTSLGNPGENITIRLKRPYEGGWQIVTQGVTNSDGRIPELLPPLRKLPSGNYKMVFDTGNYFTANNIKGFYPEVEIQFKITDTSHYHVPLLINPFGFSTYRGS